jgi:hypothetical protein
MFSELGCICLEFLLRSGIRVENVTRACKASRPADERRSGRAAYGRIAEQTRHVIHVRFNLRCSLSPTSFRGVGIQSSLVTVRARSNAQVKGGHLLRSRFRASLFGCFLLGNLLLGDAFRPYGRRRSRRRSSHGLFIVGGAPRVLRVGVRSASDQRGCASRTLTSSSSTSSSSNRPRGLTAGAATGAAEGAGVASSSLASGRRQPASGWERM